ncbi:MAG: hypothetical protein JXC33_06835 [Deltaproteobacteria bacterium]|nr:hypothetical protein [Deltaproteobacteria bacterium]
MNEEAKQKTQQSEGPERVLDYLETEDVGSGKIYSIAEEEMIIDGRKLKQNERIYELNDTIEERSVPSPHEGELSDEMLIKISEMCEKVARQMFPTIAERIIKEEIRKLKKSTKDSDE